MAWENLLGQYEYHLRYGDRELSEATVRAYCRRVRAFVSWLERDGRERAPESVTREDLKEYREFLLLRGGRRGGAPATVNLALASLRGFFGWACEHRHLPADPARGLRDIRVQEESRDSAVRWLTRREQRALLRALLGEDTPGRARELRQVRDPGRLRDLAVVALQLYAGLRVSEVCALRRCDLPLDLTVRGGAVVVRHGKGGKARQVPLSRELKAILARYLLVVEVGEEDPLLPSSRGQSAGDALTPRGVQYLVLRWGQRAGILDLSPHDLRHTFCKNLVDAGVSLDRVAALAGHESIETTRRYTKPSAEDMERAVDRVSLTDEDLALVR